MYEHSVAQDRRWLTTGAVQRALALRSTNGVRWLVRMKRLTCEWTRSGQRLFRPSDVERVGKQRADARAASRRERLVAVRLQMVRVGCEPRQLCLRLGGRGKGERSLHPAEVKPLQLVRKTA